MKLTEYRDENYRKEVYAIQQKVSVVSQSDGLKPHRDTDNLVPIRDDGTDQAPAKNSDYTSKSNCASTHPKKSLTTIPSSPANLSMGKTAAESTISSFIATSS